MKDEKSKRTTRQRQVVLNGVKELAHPTADEVYEYIRKELPRTSLATVYRNLEVLAEDGLISRLEPDRLPRRYDREIVTHLHMTCIRCGTIENIPDELSGDTFASLEQAVGKLTKYGIFGHRLEFIGLCFKCSDFSEDYFDRNHSKNK